MIPNALKAMMVEALHAHMDKYPAAYTDLEVNVSSKIENNAFQLEITYHGLRETMLFNYDVVYKGCVVESNS